MTIARLVSQAVEDQTRKLDTQFDTVVDEVAKLGELLRERLPTKYTTCVYFSAFYSGSDTRQIVPNLKASTDCTVTGHAPPPSPSTPPANG